ncbi:AAA domain-containing protein, partial [Spinellus fusiger]
LQFPNIEKSLAVLRNKKHTKRSRTVPASFKSMADYKEVFQKLIYEHLQILLLNYAIYYFSFYNNAGKNENLERYFRMKGCGFYTGCDLKEDSRQGTHDRFRIMLRNKEHHSKYNKDDIWVISKSPKFDASITFLSRSVYHGPFADGGIEIECLSPRDIRVAYNILKGDSSVYALRTITANGEFMMLDNLKEGIERTPLFPYMLKDNKQKRKLAEIMPRLELEHIRLSLEDGINVEEKIKSTIEMYHLNTDQSSVLRTVAKSVITCPGWNEESENPIILVHGNNGWAIRYLLSSCCYYYIYKRYYRHCLRHKRTREPNFFSYFGLFNDDRILLTLLKLGYDHFVRVGSLKKIKKTLLPYTAQAKLTSNDELKELEQMLADPQNTEEEIECIASTLQRFRKREHLRQIESSQVVGTTCMASVFEVFNGIRFPLVLMDECSQLMEPLNMVPLSRFSCNRLIMIGDPMQLPPTLTTNAEEETVGQGLDKTLFDRMTECHPEISNVSNRLFYSQRLVNGVTAEERKPFIQGLPNLIFVNVGGEEHRNIQSNSFWNETEVKASANIINSLLRLGAVSEDMGVIALYKQQADRLVKHLAATSENVNNNIHISTVDSFQGGEKEIIILSTVRTSSSGFIDSETRVNVALSRAKRHLIILGNRDLLNSNDLWFRILCACQGRLFISYFVALIVK